jgi:type IV secretion system protein VirB6
MGIGVAVEDAIDRLLETFVIRKCETLIGALSPLGLAAVTIYVLMTARDLATGETQSSLHELVNRLTRVLLVTAFALSIGNYQSNILATALELEEGLIAAISGVTSVGMLVDELAQPYSDLGQKLWSNALTDVWPNFALLLAAGGVAIIQCALFIVGIGLYLLAKVGFGLMIALGPVFIFCALGRSTQKYTENWVGQLLNFLALKILIALSIQMLTEFVSDFAAHIDADMDAVNVLKAVIALFCCGGALFVVMLNLPHIATALTGGATMAGIGRTVVNYMLRTSGKRSSKPGGKKGGGSIQQRPASSQRSSSSGSSSPLYQRNTLGRLQTSSSRRTS